VAINAKGYTAKLTPAEQKTIRAQAEEPIAEEMKLAQLREALERSQAEVAEKCGVKQAAISRLERRTDMRISTLRNLVEAMGGNLRILIDFQDRAPIRLSQFDEAAGAIGIGRSEGIAPGKAVPMAGSRLAGRGPARAKSRSGPIQKTQTERRSKGSGR
jgi:transcriptional regulator with XRE-family HTH domain